MRDNGKPRTDGEDRLAGDRAGAQPGVAAIALGDSPRAREALQRFFASLPARTGLAFVVLQEAPAGGGSPAPGLPGSLPAMPIVAAQDGMDVRAEHVYVAPPGRWAVVDRGRLRLIDPSAPQASPAGEALSELARSAPAAAPVPVCLTPAAGRPPGPTPTERVRVLVVDDHQVMRQGLALVLELEPGIEIVGEACDGESAVQLAGKLNPDVILMDVNLPGMSGIEATRLIHAAHPAVRVIGLSMHEEADIAQRMRDAGAVDYLSKNTPGRALTESILAWAGSAA